MSEDIYKRLREFMDTLPAGYPETPTGVEIKILKKLYSPEEAELTMKLKDKPEAVSSIADRIGMDRAELGEKLEDMALKGLIFRTREGDKRFYQAFQFLVGIYEFQLNRLDKEFSEMFEAYLPYIGISMAGHKTRQMRVIPLESSLDATPAVAPYNKVRDLVKGQEVISVQQCICRKEQELLGNPCDRPQEICIGFGDFAQYYIDNKMGRQIDEEETMKLLDLAEESGLVLSPTNTQQIEAICCCCSCCCPTLKFGNMMERPADNVQSYYEAKIDPDLCSACGICLDRCQMAAILEGDDASEIIDGRCIGCGLCVPTCPDEAITMVLKPGVEAPPETFTDVTHSLKAERGIA